MTVAVSCNLSDGVVLAVDSAVGLRDAGGVTKVYENAEKLFPVRDRPIGIAVYGLGALGDRSLGSYLHEFERESPVAADPNSPLPDVVEALREFVLDAYMREVAPDLERSQGKPWERIAEAEKPKLGLVIGGFSSGAHLSEVWLVEVPRHATPRSAGLIQGQGEFGAKWYAKAIPIERYARGADVGLISAIVRYMVNRSTALSAAEEQEIDRILGEYDYPIPYGVMPMLDGVAHARFLVELVINHHRYMPGLPVVGGHVHVGKTDYRHGAFELVH